MPYAAFCRVVLRTCLMALAAIVITTVDAADELIVPGDVADEPAVRLVYESPKTQRWQVGLKLDTNGVTCNDILATFPVPTDWPEQTVKVVSQKIDPAVAQWDIRDLPGGARQVVLTI